MFLRMDQDVRVDADVRSATKDVNLMKNDTDFTLD